MPATNAEPNLIIRVAGETGGSGPWEIAFEVENAGPNSLDLIEAWLPHEVLHADAMDLTEQPLIGPGDKATMSFTATFAMREKGEPSNLFLIIRLSDSGLQWRVLARLAVARGPRAEPVIDVASVTMHRVGFSAASS